MICNIGFSYEKKKVAHIHFPITTPCGKPTNKSSQSLHSESTLVLNLLSDKKDEISLYDLQLNPYVFSLTNRKPC